MSLQFEQLRPFTQFHTKLNKSIWRAFAFRRPNLLASRKWVFMLSVNKVHTPFIIVLSLNDTSLAYSCTFISFSNSGYTMHLTVVCIAINLRYFCCCCWNHQVCFSSAIRISFKCALLGIWEYVTRSVWMHEFDILLFASLRFEFNRSPFECCFVFFFSVPHKYYCNSTALFPVTLQIDA